MYFHPLQPNPHPHHLILRHRQFPHLQASVSPVSSLLLQFHSVLSQLPYLLPYLLTFLQSGFQLNPSYTSGLLHLLLLQFLLLQRLLLHFEMSGFLLRPPDRLESLRMLQMQRHFLSDNMLPHFLGIPHILNHLLRYCQYLRCFHNKYPGHLPQNLRLLK